MNTCEIKNIVPFADMLFVYEDLKMKKLVVLLMIYLPAWSVYSQQENADIRRGNEYFLDSNFVDAEVSYKKAYEKNQDSYKAAFNIGTALYKQERYGEASSSFEALLGKETNPERLSKIHYNLGNCKMKEQKYEEAVTSFKNALRFNSADEEARYNLAYAQKMLEQQQQGGGGQNQNQQNQDQNQDQKENDESGEGKGDNKNKNDKQDSKDKKGEGDKDQKDKKDDDKNKGNQEQDKNKDQDKQDQQQGKQDKEQQISKEDMERMLEALEGDEKQTQQKVEEEKARRAGKVRVEKDW